MSPKTGREERGDEGRTEERAHSFPEVSGAWVTSCSTGYPTFRGREERNNKTVKPCSRE